MSLVPPPAQRPPLLYAIPRKRPRPTWPLVIGIISVVVSIVCLIMRLVSLSIQWKSGSIGPFIHGFLSASLDLVLLAGGILLINRKPAGKKLHVFWSFLSLFGVGALVVLLVIWYGDSTAIERQNYGREMICLGIGSVILAAYPVFLLIWLSRRFIERDLSRW